MHLSPVLDPAGRPVFSAGGEHSWKAFEHRGYAVSLEWVVSDTRRRAAPCMVIWAAANVFVPGAGDSGMWAIGRNAISEFVGFGANGKCTGGASEHCYRECLAAMPVLGKDPNDKAAFLALVDTVIKFAPELVLMPSTPRWLQRRDAAAPLIEVIATNKDTGKVLSHTEV